MDIGPLLSVGRYVTSVSTNLYNFMMKFSSNPTMELQLDSHPIWTHGTGNKGGGEIKLSNRMLFYFCPSFVVTASVSCALSPSHLILILILRKVHIVLKGKKKVFNLIPT